MAKKFGKFLLFTAAVGGAAAAVYYYLRKKDTDSDILDEEDYDDFSEDLDEDAEPTTNYVPLTPETRDSSPDTSSDTSEKDSFVPLEQVAQNADKSGKDEDGKSDVEVEEFFDEDDETEEDPPLSDN